MPGRAMDPKQHAIKTEHEDALGDEDASVYRPRPQLPSAFVCMRSLADLIKDLNDNKIDVNPEYQREVVWTADRMTGLVNSLMENFYIPPIILNKKSNTAPANRPQDAVLVCVDGKQRLSSVRAFVQGLIPCHDHNDEKWWFAETAIPRKRILSKEAQRMFLAKEFVSFEFSDLSSEQEEDLFARVQMGVQLSLAEKMRASTGPWQELARLYVEDFPNVYSLMKDRARAKDFQLTLSCFSQILEVMHPAALDGIPILRTNHSALPKLLSNKGAVDDGLKSHLASVWNTLKDLIDQDPNTFTNANKYLRGVQTFAPVEMVAVTVLISQYSETRNKRLLLGDIQAMREAIREKFVDLRLNTPLWKFLWDFIENLEGIRGAVDGTTVRKGKEPSATATPTMTRPSSVPTPKSSVKGKAKAKDKAPQSLSVPRVLPPQEAFTFKVEEDNNPAPSDVRKRKRQRTDPDASSAAEDPPSQPRFQSMPFRSVTPSGAESPSRSATAANTSPGPQAGSSTWATMAEANAFSQLSSPTVSRKPRGSVRAPPVGADSRQASAGAMDSYKASSATIFSAAPQIPGNHSPISPTDSARFPSTQSAASPIIRDSRSHFTSNGRPGHNIGLVKMAPDHLQKQREELHENNQQVGPSSVSSAKREPRKTAPQAPPAQLDGPVDLTSDTEQEEERQNLLTSFGAKTLADRDGRTAKTKAAITDSATFPATSMTATTDTTQFPPANGKKQSRKSPVNGNNPYTRFQQGANSS